MAFRDNIAPKRLDPNGNDLGPGPALASDSNQALTQGQTAKFRNVGDAPNAGVNIGNQVGFHPNSKGTGVFGRPSSLGNKGRSYIITPKD